MYIYIRMYTRVYVYPCVCISIHTCMYAVRSCLCAYIRAYIYIHIYICLRVCQYMCVYAYPFLNVAHIYMNLYEYTCAVDSWYIHTYMHTYIHTYTHYAAKHDTVTLGWIA